MNIENIKLELCSLRSQYIDRARELFTLATKDIFNNHSILQDFSWCQFTDYFNDGETCEFRIREYTIHGNGRDGEEYDDLRYSAKTNPSLLPMVNALKDCVNLIYVFDPEVFKEIFGDHIMVTITRDGNNIVENHEDHD